MENCVFRVFQKVYFFFLLEVTGRGVFNILYRLIQTDKTYRKKLKFLIFVLIFVLVLIYVLSEYHIIFSILYNIFTASPPGVRILVEGGLGTRNTKCTIVPLKRAANMFTLRCTENEKTTSGRKCGMHMCAGGPTQPTNATRRENTHVADFTQVPKYTSKRQPIYTFN